jgi:hypothetical protein
MIPGAFTALGSVFLFVGLCCAWLDTASNGATQATWAGLMLTLATLGAIMIGVDYVGSGQ